MHGTGGGYFRMIVCAVRDRPIKASCESSAPLVSLEFTIGEGQVGDGTVRTDNTE